MAKSMLPATTSSWLCAAPLYGTTWNLRSASLRERFGDHLAGARQPRHAVGQRLRARLGLGDEILQRLHVALGADDEDDRRAREIGDVGQILERVVADLGIDQRIDRGERQRGDDEIVAVGIGMGDEVDADHAAGAGAGLDIELLAERLGQLVGRHAGQNVGGAARRKRIDDAHRMARPILGRGRRRASQNHGGKSRRARQRNVFPHSAATRCAATPLAFTTTLIASSTRSLA